MKISRRKILIIGILGLIVVFFICVRTIPRFPYGPYKLYANVTESQLSAKIPYEKLADRHSDPLYGWDYIRPHYVDAVEKYPDVRTCLIAGEQAKADPDLRLIDLDNISSHREMYVCLWRIFSSLGAVERTREWMEFHGFRTYLYEDEGYDHRTGNTKKSLCQL